jgi:hypothetical protein
LYWRFQEQGQIGIHRTLSSGVGPDFPATHADRIPLLSARRTTTGVLPPPGLHRTAEGSYKNWRDSESFGTKNLPPSLWSVKETQKALSEGLVKLFEGLPLIEIRQVFLKYLGDARRSGRWSELSLQPEDGWELSTPRTRAVLVSPPWHAVSPQTATHTYSDVGNTDKVSFFVNLLLSKALPSI